MIEDNSELHQLDKTLVWSGFKQLAPIAIFVVAFGAAFSLAAIQAGLSDSVIVTMSSLVFAGAAQFAVLDLWGPQVPFFTMMITVFAINAWHLLMGATLYPWLRHLPPAKRYGVMLFVSDANWAKSMQAFNRGQPGMGLLLGGGLALWFFWVLGSWLGVYLGDAVKDPKTVGLDMVMGCFLLAMVLEGDRNFQILGIWVVAAISSMLAYWYLPDNSHVIIGALAGGFTGLLYGNQESDS